MGSYGESESESEQQSSSYLPIQEDVLTQFLESERAKIGAGQESYPGLTVAPFQDLQNQAISLAPESFFRTEAQEDELFTSGIEAPAMERFNQETVPLIREEFAGPGFWSSARAQETVSAGESLATELEAERQTLRQETEAMNQAGVTTLFDFGTAQQEQQQAEIDAEIQTFLESNRLTDPEDVAILTALLGLNYSTSSGDSSSSSFNIGIEGSK